MKKKIFLLIFLSLLIFSSSALATAQWPDHLIYKGKTVKLFTNPLYSYFKNNPPPKGLFKSTCSAIWRGYVATWQIIDDYLYLVRLVEGTCDSNAPEIPLSKIFPGAKKPVKATWYSGTLLVPEGKMLDYVHMGYRSVYEKETRLTIENGKVTGTRTVKNKKKSN